MITTAIDPPKTTRKFEVHRDAAKYVQLVYTVNKYGDGHANIKIGDFSSTKRRPGSFSIVAITMGRIILIAEKVVSDSSDSSNMGKIIFTGHNPNQMPKLKTGQIIVGPYGNINEIPAHDLKTNYKISLNIAKYEQIRHIYKTL